MGSLGKGLKRLGLGGSLAGGVGVRDGTNVERGEDEGSGRLIQVFEQFAAPHAFSLLHTKRNNYRGVESLFIHP